MTTLKYLENGFEYIEVVNDAAQAKVALQGAHLFHYARHHEAPILWVSNASAFATGDAIRGGVPICWPWFGMPADAMLPQHGFARTALWTFIGSKETPEVTELTFCLKSSAETLAMWPYRFELIYRMTIGSELTLELTTANCDSKAFTISQALHTYFSVSHISNIHVNGLDTKPYWNALTNTECLQEGSITVNQEVDRVYRDVSNPVVLVDTKRTVTITNTGSASVVVWNPWIHKCARMRAMEPTGYKTMVCIESANARDDARTIKPAQTHTLTTRIECR